MAAKRSLSFHLPLFPYDRWGGIEAIGRVAQGVETLGYAGLIFPDHVIMPLKPGVPPVSTVWYDGFVLGAHLAAMTRRIRMVFNVLVVPYRPAIVLAKLVSTLDVVSGGRLTLGVGAGWIKGEFKALNIPYAERGAITSETLRAMKVLWTEEHPSFEGRYTSFSNIAFEPKCLQQPHVKIWIGGSGAAPLQRVVELGDGWSPMQGDLPELERHVRWIRKELAARGRDGSMASRRSAPRSSRQVPDSHRETASACHPAPRWCCMTLSVVSTTRPPVGPENVIQIG